MKVRGGEERRQDEPVGDARGQGFNMSMFTDCRSLY